MAADEISDIERARFLLDDAQPSQYLAIISVLLNVIRRQDRHRVTDLLTGDQYRNRLRKLMVDVMDHPFRELVVRLRLPMGLHFPQGVILRIDVNGLSLANRGGNHQRGNRLLVCVAESLTYGLHKCQYEIQENRWDTDTSKAVLSHIHGDEFAILIPNLENGDRVDELCEEILQNLNAKTIPGLPMQPDVSIGRVDIVRVLRELNQFYARYPRFKNMEDERRTLTRAIIFADRLADAYCDKTKVEARLAMMAKIMWKDYERYQDLISYLRKGAFNAQDEVFKTISQCKDDPKCLLQRTREEACKLAKNYHDQLDEQIRGDWSDSDFQVRLDQFVVERAYSLNA
jgi:GGDEF domain-containing protein